MDPPSTVILNEDTTFALMWEAAEQGDEIHVCGIADVGLNQGSATATVSKARVQQDALNPVVLLDQEQVELRDFDAVWLRKDPPFDETYLWATQMLERASAETLVVNSPRGLREANEKLYACSFTELMPRTRVSANRQQIREFVEALGGEAIIKPLGGAGGQGVVVLELDRNFNSIVDLLTQNGTCVAMVQQFVPEVTKGDKRIILLDGEPLGAIVRVPQKGDVRSNIHVGGRVERGELTARDIEICYVIAPALRRDGLWFVGIDVIGGYLTEINVTSPTGIQQMMRLDQRNYCAEVLDALKQKVATR